MSERAAFWITDILSDADAREFVFGRGGSLDFPFPVAVKTGTSEGYEITGRSATRVKSQSACGWAISIARRSKFIRGTGAGPIFHGVMLAAERRVAGHRERRRQCAGSDALRISSDARSARCPAWPANPWCPTKTSEWLPSHIGADSVHPSMLLFFLFLTHHPPRLPPPPEGQGPCRQGRSPGTA